MKGPAHMVEGSHHLRKAPNLHPLVNSVIFPIVKGLIFDLFSIAKGTILALNLRSQGYGCENPGRTPRSKFFRVTPPTPGLNSMLVNKIF